MAIATTQLEKETAWYKTISPDQWSAVNAAMWGWGLDAFDVMLYTLSITLIMKEWGISPVTAGFLASVTLFSSAFGGAAFGIISDYIGRTRALMITVIIYSIFTALCGFAQNVTQLALCRLLLGLGMGGEWTAGSVLVSETWPAEQGGWAIGYLLAAGVAAIILPRFGWRPLFFIGILPALLICYIRSKVKEPEIWKDNVAKKRASRPTGFTFWAIFKPAMLRFTIFGSLMILATSPAYWGLFTWIPSFLASSPAQGGAGLTIVKSMTWIMAMQVGAWLGYVTFGTIADRLGRKPAFSIYLVVTGILVPIYGQLRSPVLLFVFAPLLGFFGSGYFAGFGAFISEMFPTAIRATAQGFIYNSGRLASSLAPIIIGYAAGLWGFGSALAIISIFCLAGLVALQFLPETKGTVLATLDQGPS
jgi:MFS family permease